MNRLILIKGAGDLATGIAHRLYRSGFLVVMTELAQPTVIRRTVSFAEAVYRGRTEVEGVIAVCTKLSDLAATLEQDVIPVVIDERGKCVQERNWAAVVDAILAKRNIATALTDAPLVVGVGPGFTVGKDVHFVVETKRGHDLGRVLLSGTAAADTAVPGNIGGYTIERLLQAPCAGIFQGLKNIGDIVSKGEVVATVEKQPVFAKIGGVLRGLLKSGLTVQEGMKIGDIDPRGCREYCFTISDKARAVGGGVLEALLMSKLTGE
jgi:xanthine dehydrogenase accessory factor